MIVEDGRLRERLTCSEKPASELAIVVVDKVEELVVDVIFISSFSRSRPGLAHTLASMTARPFTCPALKIEK